MSRFIVIYLNTDKICKAKTNNILGKKCRAKTNNIMERESIRLYQGFFVKYFSIFCFL